MNPILQNVKASIMAKSPKLAPVLQKAEAAGMKFMVAPQTRQMVMQQLGGGHNDPEVIGAGIAKLVGILYTESKKTLPPQTFGPLGTILLCDALEILEEAGKVQVTPDFMAKCQQATGSALMQLLGVTPEKLQQMMQQAQARQAGGEATGAGMPAAPAPAGIVGGAMQGGA